MCILQLALDCLDCVLQAGHLACMLALQLLPLLLLLLQGGLHARLELLKLILQACV